MTTSTRHGPGLFPRPGGEGAALRSGVLGEDPGPAPGISWLDKR